MKTFLTFLFIFTTFLLGSAQELFKQGDITPKVKCVDDTSQHYALYLPSNYSKDIAWPVIFFFEPGARAKLPLEKYHAFGEKYGYIMVCSYNSRNGPNQPIFDAANAMYNDVLLRFNVDENRNTLAGFSGGARISSLIGLANAKIKSVVGCGAGFPYSDPPEKKVNFDYMAIIGKRDMNYQELINLDSILNSFCENHVLETFSLGHQWPEAQTFQRAFFWLESNAIREGIKPKDSILADEIKDYYSQGLVLAEQQRIILDQLLILKNEIQMLAGLTETKLQQEKYNALIQSEEYKSAYQASIRIRKIELGLQKKYYEEFEQISLRNINPQHKIKTKAWWKKEFDMINALDNEDLSARLNGFLISGSWEQYYNSYRLNRYEVARCFLNIYACGLPEEASPLILLAMVSASEGNSTEMYHQINKALEKGLKNSEQLTNEEAFEPYVDQKRFQKILKELKSE